MQLIAEKAVTIPEIATLPLAEARAAQQLSESRHVRGKLVLTTR